MCRFEFADLEVYASDEDGELSVSTEADESEEVSNSGSDAADEVDAFFCTLIRAGSAIGCLPSYVTGILLGILDCRLTQRLAVVMLPAI